MGFLDNLLGNDAKNRVTAILDKVSDALTSTAPTDSVTKSPQPQQRETHHTSKTLAVDFTMDMAVVCANIQSSVAIYLTDYTIKENVSPTELGGQEGNRLFNYCLYLNDVMKCAILVTDPYSDYSTKDDITFQNAKQIAAKAGIPFIHFDTQSPHSKDDVTSEIKKFIL